jgi:hypothetical protein
VLALWSPQKRLLSSSRYTGFCPLQALPAPWQQHEAKPCRDNTIPRQHSVLLHTIDTVVTKVTRVVPRHMSATQKTCIYWMWAGMRVLPAYTVMAYLILRHPQNNCRVMGITSHITIHAACSVCVHQYDMHSDQNHLESTHLQ